ncbi:hypothetical protein QUA61_17150 [Microcoleus sp. M2_C4]
MELLILDVHNPRYAGATSSATTQGKAADNPIILVTASIHKAVKNIQSKAVFCNNPIELFKTYL